MQTPCANSPAGQPLTQTGLENNRENIGKLVIAALDKKSSGATIGDAMKEQGLSWQSSEGNNRTFMTLARYMSALEDGGDIGSIIEVMEGFGENTEGQEDTADGIRYSLSDMQKLPWDEQMDRYFSRQTKPAMFLK